LVYFSFKDNGKGFDVNKKEKGIGLQNMSSRVKDLGGELQINSSTNNGTEIYLTLPFESSPSQKE
jgi:signal transduction histidine kinase